MSDPFLKASALPLVTSLGAADEVIVRTPPALGAALKLARITKANLALGGPGGAVTSVAGRTGDVVLTNADVGLGNVDNTADAAKPLSAAGVAALALKADLASPALTGNPTAPTQAVDDSSTKLASTAFVSGQLSALGDGVPIVDGTAARGTSSHGARADHVHPTDATRAPLASPALTGVPTAPTAAPGTSTTQLATTAFAAAAAAAATGAVSSVAGRTGAVVLAKADVGLANVANVDSTNASNLATGTVPAARLPVPAVAALGGVNSKAAVANNFLTAIGTDGSVTQARPAAADVSGLAASATIDTTNAANVSSGLLPNARLNFAVPAGAVVGTTDVQTLSNKRNTKRVVVTTQSATPTINTDSTDIASITALAQAITSMTTNLSGTPVAGDMLMIELTDNATARAITWGASYEATTVALPATTVASAKLRVLFLWNTATSKWSCIGVA